MQATQTLKFIVSDFGDKARIIENCKGGESFVVEGSDYKELKRLSNNFNLEAPIFDYQVDACFA